MTETEQSVQTRVCACAQFHSYELLQIWQARAMPIVRRMILHGHTVSYAELQKTVSLVMKLPSGDKECFAAENRHKSHHLKDCPAAYRNKDRRIEFPDPNKLLKAAQVHLQRGFV